MNWEEFGEKIIELGLRLERRPFPQAGISVFDKNNEEISFISESYLKRNIDWNKDFDFLLYTIGKENESRRI
jgi:hypothetical protein